ncbi:MAG: 8-amino-7-oxononanoate synthase [Acidimicrobiales bacterium]
MSWAEWAESKNTKTRAKGRWRKLSDFDAIGPRGLLDDGRTVVSFASNDYLGLSAHPRVLAAAHDAIEKWGAGAGASRLVSGSRPVHTELEAVLADWKSSEAALVFPSGFATNVGVLSAIAGPQVLICSDELNHASIIDGCRLAENLGAVVEVYPHCDVDAVSKLLSSTSGRAVVVTDAVFSMDGDVAPVNDLAQACSQHDALLVIDEAHSVLGPHFSDLPCEVLRVGTLSKTLGSQGGFVAGRRLMTEMLVNRSRSFIFTTALAPANAAAAKAAAEVLRSQEGEQLLGRLRGHIAKFGVSGPPLSPIVPIVVGGEREALAASAALLAEGLFVPAIRPPTVPPGSSRLRVTLSAAHTDQEVLKLVSALERLGLGTR